jgi:uncharacterized protein involved in response to NO
MADSDTLLARSENGLTRSFAHLCQEPFRIFFPAGALLGLTGVSLWVLYYCGAGVPYPNVAHARLMIEGMMASFIFGFLGTAGPRLTSTPHFSVGEVGTLFTLDLLAAGLHVAEAHRFADSCFLVCLLVFAAILLKRFRRREDNPPPNFVLVVLGLISGIAGAALVAWSGEAQYSFAYQFGIALLNQCFVLLPVLGVAPFFIGKLLDLPSSNLPESRAFPAAWKRRAALNAFIGLIVIGTFLLESLSPNQAAAWIRAGAIAVYLLLRMPWRGRTFLADYLRISLLFILAGFTAIALWPGYRIGELHIIFITGFNLIVFTVATRVVFGHSGQIERLKGRLWFFIVMSGLLFLAMISRVTADLAPAARTIHLVGAAFCWLAGALLWFVKTIPKVAITGEE